jgi:membrane protease YdiL (CAAX protease family)
MSASSRFWVARFGELFAAAALLLLLRGQSSDAMAPLPAVALGLLVAGGLLPLALLFQPAQRPRPLAITFGVAVFLVLRAAVEEVVWRLAVTGRIATVAGWPAGLTIGALGFGLAHAGPLRVLVARICIGLFLATGRLLAAVAAHAAYNLLVLALTLRRT